MKVYIVQGHDYDDHWVVGAYSSPELAQTKVNERIAKISPKRVYPSEDYSFGEWELDDD